MRGGEETFFELDRLKKRKTVKVNMNNSLASGVGEDDLEGIF